MKKLIDLKTYEDACAILGIDPETVSVSGVSTDDCNALYAVAKLFIIVRAANKLVNDGNEWKPDWNDGKWKYTAYFYIGGSSGFRSGGFGDWYSSSDVGSRLCFKTSEAAEYIGTQFTDLYKSFMLIN
jgi:hypothetical protein